MNYELEIYPNPVASQLGIRNYELGIREVKIYNVLGECVLAPLSFLQGEGSGVRSKEAGGEVLVDVSILPSGVCFIEMVVERSRNHSETQRTKFIKQ